MQTLKGKVAIDGTQPISYVGEGVFHNGSFVVRESQ